VSRAELRRRWREATSWVAPMEYWSFLSLRTIFLSLAVGALAGSQIGGTAVAVVVGLAVYVVAALHPRNVTTCRFCGEGVNPRATRCRSCIPDLV
jgi:hypothetical protein